MEKPKEKNTVSEISFEFNGEVYIFAPDAPEKIRINGSVKTQEEIAEDEDIQLQLVAGNSSLIIKKL